MICENSENSFESKRHSIEIKIFFPCECGQQICIQSIRNHLFSIQHKDGLKKLIQKKKVSIGKNSIILCICGQIMTLGEQANHLDSKQHYEQLQQEFQGIFSCQECGISYNQKIEQHKQKFNHKRNIERLSSIKNHKFITRKIKSLRDKNEQNLVYVFLRQQREKEIKQQQQYKQLCQYFTKMQIQ